MAVIVSEPDHPLSVRNLWPLMISKAYFYVLFNSKKWLLPATYPVLIYSKPVISAWITPQTKENRRYLITWYNAPLLGATTCEYPTNVSIKGWYNNEFSVWPCTKTVITAFPRSTSIWPLGSASAPYLVVLGSRELTNTCRDHWTYMPSTCYTTYKDSLLMNPCKRYMYIYIHTTKFETRQ